MFQQHRQNFLTRLAELHACALVFSGSEQRRNHDCNHRFRPDSDFFYLTGFAEPESALLLRPGASEPALLFLRERVREEEQWNGRRLGTQAAPAQLGVDRAFAIDELWGKLPALLKGFAGLVYKSAQDGERDRRLLALLHETRMRNKGQAVSPQELLEPAASLHELRLFKSPAELECMRRAAAISREAHSACMRAVRPGLGEHELDALLEGTFRRLGASGAAYNHIVAGGANACILHYNENDQPLGQNDLVLIDAGAEFRFYASDVTRTFPVSGHFTPEQRALYEVVLDAQLAAIECVTPANTFLQVHERALERLVHGLVRLGLLAGPVDKAIAEGSYRRFFMHRTGHWLGLDVHDCGAYWSGLDSRRLEPGMVTTVEPGLYISPDDETVEARWRGIGIRIEDDLLVTATGHEVLSAGIPKALDELERLCGSDHRPASSARPQGARASGALQ